MKIKLIYLIFASPLIILLEIMGFSFVFELLRQPSDVAVLVGIASSCGFVMGNYFLITYIIKQFKPKKP